MTNLYKIMFFNMLILSTMISVSSYSWMGMWMGLEINLLSFIPLMNSSKNMLSSESSIKYFLSQTMASLILFFAVSTMLMNFEFMPEMNSSYSLMIDLALLTKMGAAPFHFWFIEVMEGLSWMNCLILLTWQKIAPMILMINNMINMKLILIIIISCLIISSIMSMNQTSLRKILTFSSINHIAWMLTAMMISFSSWLVYFIIYSMVSIIVVKIFHNSKSFYLNQHISNNSDKMTKLTLAINFLSMGGLPPFLGFLPKWMIIIAMSKINPLLVLILIMFTLIMLFVYTRILYSSLIMAHSETKNFAKTEFNFSIMLFNFISISSLILSPMILT